MAKRTQGRPRAKKKTARSTSKEITFAAYARHRGVSRVAVHKALGKRLIRSVRWDGKKQIAIVDVALADREWAANTDLSRAPDAVKVKAAADAIAVRLEPQAHGGALKRSVALPPPDDQGEAAALAKASAREKHFRAKLAELKYRERAGELVEAAGIQAQLVDTITTCRTKLLGLPSKAKQRLPHLTLEDLATIEAIVREALEELVPLKEATDGPRQSP